MTANKHTPGNWYTHRSGFSTVYVEARIGGGMVQEIAACGPTEAGAEQQEANARLIAAAPELLEALVEMTALAAGPTGGVTVQQKRDVVSKARAAIAKATGGAA